MTINKLITTIVLVTISGCATVIGGFASTSKTSGGAYGPATLNYGDTVLNNDKLIALTVVSGNAHLGQFAIKEQLNVDGNLWLENVRLNGEVFTHGTLVTHNSKFYQACSVESDLNALRSYWAGNIKVGGRSVIFADKSKVVGNVISTNPESVVLVVDHAYLKGNIGFTNSASSVIIQNHGYVKGQIINARVHDLTGADSYGGDDEIESD